MNCKHDQAEIDTAVADGMCPLCLADQVDQLKQAITDLHKVTFYVSDETWNNFVAAYAKLLFLAGLRNSKDIAGRE